MLPVLYQPSLQSKGFSSNINPLTHSLTVRVVANQRADINEMPKDRINYATTFLRVTNIVQNKVLAIKAYAGNDTVTKFSFRIDSKISP